MATRMALQGWPIYSYKISAESHLGLLDAGMDPKRHYKQDSTNLFSLPLEGTTHGEDFCLGQLGQDREA